MAGNRRKGMPSLLLLPCLATWGVGPLEADTLQSVVEVGESSRTIVGPVEDSGRAAVATREVVWNVDGASEALDALKERLFWDTTGGAIPAALSPNAFGAAVDPVGGPLANASFAAVLEGIGPQVFGVRRTLAEPISIAQAARSPNDDLLSVAARASDLDVVEVCQQLAVAFMPNPSDGDCRLDGQDSAFAETVGRFYLSVGPVSRIDYPMIEVLMIGQSSRLSQTASRGFDRLHYEVYWSFDERGRVYVDTIMVRALSYQGGSGNEAFDRLQFDYDRYTTVDLVRKSAQDVREFGDRIENVFERLTVN